MQTFDWIVVGNGLAGAALGYELARQGLSVLLLERSPDPESATRYSYGGVPYWSGDTDLMRQFCQEGRARYLALTEETGVDTEFRDLDLLLTVNPDQTSDDIAQRYAGTATPPAPISPQEAVEREPSLNPDAIAGALTVRHGHVNPQALVKAYNNGLQALGGRLVIAPVTGLVRVGDRITGVTTPTQAYAGKSVAIAAGGETRRLLNTINLSVPVYFTHAEIIETPPLEPTLRTLIMPADLSRSELEAEASRPDVDALWDEVGHTLAPPILDAGCVQFRDGTVRIGQISRINTTLHPDLNAYTSEQQLRQGIAPLVSTLAKSPGNWRACQVAFSRDGLPLAGAVPGLEGVALFAGFTSPFAIVPAIAVRFAQWATGQSSPAMDAISPARFAQ